MTWKIGTWAGVTIAIAVCVIAATPEAPEGGWVGMTLQSVLSTLNEQGVPVVFSTALVLPEMRVGREPESGETKGFLVEILEPHGLGIQEGPGGRLVVVKAPEKRPFGGIRGRITLEGELVPLPRVRVEIVGTDAQAHPDEEGWFELSQVPVGRHNVVARGAGTVPQLIEGVVVDEGKTARIDFDL
ncbi:MAG: carboxypeptidase-like regulatory domain-containing protein, partial [Acidobacteriota bacterium]